MTFETINNISQIIFADIILSGDNALIINMSAFGLAPKLAQTRDNAWHGIGGRIAVNLQTAWLSSPLALSAYFLRALYEWDLNDIYLGMMQFMVVQLIGMALIFMFPQFALWLPTYIYGQ